MTAMPATSGFHASPPGGDRRAGPVGSTAVPDGVVLGLGLVSGSAASIEDPASIAARVRSTSGLPPADRLQLGTGTSLASLPLATAIAKLKALDGARRLLAAS